MTYTYSIDFSHPKRQIDSVNFPEKNDMNKLKAKLLYIKRIGFIFVGCTIDLSVFSYMYIDTKAIKKHIKYTPTIPKSS